MRAAIGREVLRAMIAVDANVLVRIVTGEIPSGSWPRGRCSRVNRSGLRKRYCTKPVECSGANALTKMLPPVCAGRWPRRSRHTEWNSPMPCT